MRQKLNLAYGEVHGAEGYLRLESLVEQALDEGWSVGAGLTYIGRGIDSTNSLDRDFKEYQDTGVIVRVSPRSNFVKMDRGISQNIERGMSVDIFQSDFFGGNVLVATGTVFSVESDTSVVKINKIHRNIPIKKGFIVRIR